MQKRDLSKKHQRSYIPHNHNEYNSGDHIMSNARGQYLQQSQGYPPLVYPYFYKQESRAKPIQARFHLSHEYGPILSTKVINHKSFCKLCACYVPITIYIHTNMILKNRNKGPPVPKLSSPQIEQKPASIKLLKNFHPVGTLHFTGKKQTYTSHTYWY